MACPLCGERCTCSHVDRAGESPAGAGDAHVAVLIDPESYEASEQQFAASLDSEPAAPPAAPPVEQPQPWAQAEPRIPGENFYRPETVWRDEVSSRVDAYRARRRRLRPGDSLSLDFGQSAPEPPPARVQRPRPQLVVMETPKVIEFPKPEPEPVLGFEELAEPVVETPRIMEAPAEDVLPPLFGGVSLAAITLEDPEHAIQPELGPTPGLEVAPRALRSFAGLLDALVVAVATAIFAMIFFQMNEAVPRSRVGLMMAVCIPVFFWSVYHYLFLVHAAATPGMQLAGLRLSTFEGAAAGRRLRRWRALAMVMSCLPVGLGLLWAGLDEDGLCWHDRVTRTYLRRR